MVDIAIQRLHAALQGSDPSAVDKAVALDELLLYLRHQRFGLVQTLGQYVFAYKALMEELQVLVARDGVV